MLAYFETCLARGVKAVDAKAVGYITRIVGLTLEARGINLALGGRCIVGDIDSSSNDNMDDAPGDTLEAANKNTHSRYDNKQSCFEVEVVGFDSEVTYLMPLRPIASVKPGARVTPINSSEEVPAGNNLLGRVIDGTGKPLDSKGPLGLCDKIKFHPDAINPLLRKPISEPLDVGVRSVNASLTIGCGQRVGLFAGSGVGKSVLLGMMTRFTEAEVVVVALVGERGREVREFVETNLGNEGMAKTIVVAAPADETPVMRLRAGMYAARLSEYFRDQGKRTLLLFDSLTRYAQAQREIALATGEPPATRGYPPSVFARLPQLVERAGNGVGDGGSVTAFYTVLVEGDDLSDPVADAARAILDGHIVLSRDIAGQGIYPAIDIQASISRSMTAIVEAPHLMAANQVKQLYSRYEQSKDLISVGAYTAGVDPITDLAIERQPQIQAFLSQSLDEAVNMQDSVRDLMSILETKDQAQAGQNQVDQSNPTTVFQGGRNNQGATIVQDETIEQNNVNGGASIANR